MFNQGKGNSGSVIRTLTMALSTGRVFCFKSDSYCQHLGAREMYIVQVLSSLRTLEPREQIRPRSRTEIPPGGRGRGGISA